MHLPIDARLAPFRTKYIDEETPMLSRWFVYGIDVADGTFCINNGTDDVVVGLTKEQAETLIRARERFVDAVLQVFGSQFL
jgi:hypothetical protein